MGKVLNGDLVLTPKGKHCEFTKNYFDYVGYVAIEYNYTDPSRGVFMHTKESKIVRSIFFVMKLRKNTFVRILTNSPKMSINYAKIVNKNF